MDHAMDHIDIFRHLVAFDTTSCNSNLEAAHFLAERLEDAGCRVDLLPSPAGDKANLMARVGPDDGAGLLLSGHLDVVPALEAGWSSPPFELTDSGDAYRARGSADMKGFIALAAEAAMRAARQRLAHGLVLLFTYDEEVGTVGAHDFVESWDGRCALPRAGVIGEPTSLRVIRAHKGHLKLRLTAHGIPAHSGYPDLGSNAIEKAASAIGVLRALAALLKGERTPSSPLFPEYPHATVNVATIEGGTAINIVPDRCTIDIGVRLLPGQETAELLARLRAGLADAGLIETGDFTLEVVNDSPPMSTPEDAPIHREACALVGQQRSAGVSFAADSGHLGRLGIDCVLFGPGSIEVAHKPNEYVPKRELEDARTTLAELVASRCGAG